ncbi:hypothetical protein [uncultured Alistipes sp.]|uniref:hypothetical protein n=1 Tax=uncultured Alistipes sp. TaxID=538949 RepID=UPI00260C2E2E|nr:hypothetical protein [uncultured Alistipes sp.]
MDNSIFQLYINSSQALIDAMKNAVQIINIDGDIQREQNRIRQLSSEDESNLLLRNTTSLLITREKYVQIINEKLIDSCFQIIDYIKEIININSNAEEVRLAQQQLTAIVDFIQKPYILKDINLSSLSTTILSTTNDLNKKEGLPQYKLLIDYLTKLYFLAIKDQ